MLRAPTQSKGLCLYAPVKTYHEKKNIMAISVEKV